MEGQGHQLRILGPPRILVEDGTPVDLAIGKPLALLTYLHLSGAAVPRDDLGALLWPDSPRDRARGSLRHALWTLRRTLGEGLFTGEDPVAVAPGRITSDLEALRDRLASGDVEGARDLWKGPPFQAFRIPDAPEWGRWAEDIRLELEERYAAGLSSLGRRHWEQGRPEDGVAWFREAVAIQPHRLRHHLDLVESLIDLRRFDEAGKALSEARRFCDSTAQQRTLEEVERRLLTLRRGARGGERNGDPLRFAFVGRTQEFTALLRNWRKAQSGRSQVGLITGEPGIGKTRISEEVGLVVTAEGGRVVHVKAEDSERPIEWGIVAEVVQRLLKLSGAAGISRASDDVLHTLLPSLALPDPTEEDPTEKDPITRSGPFRPPRTRPSAALTDALADLIHAVAEDAPLLVILDDLHWTDTESRAILARVATHLREASVFLLFTCRSEGDDPRVQKTLTLLAEAPGTLSLELAPWSREELTELLGLLVEFTASPEADRVIRRIHRASRGNPLFVMELLKVFHEEGYLEEKEGRWTLRPQRIPSDFPLPESLRGLVDRQLAQLSDEGTLVAAHLARIGHPASARTLAARTGLGSSAVTHGIGELLQRRMIRWEDGESLGFTHDEIREAVARRFQLQPDAGDATWIGWPPSPGVLTGGVALLLLVLAALTMQRPASPPPPPFGAGEIRVHAGDRILAFELRGATADGLHPLETSGLLRRASERDLAERGPERVSEAGSEGPLAATLDRVGPWQLQAHAGPWGGRTELVLASAPGRMRAQDDGNGVPAGERVIRVTDRRIQFAAFSPSMTRIAVGLMGRPDSLEILTLGGERRGGLTFPSLLGAAWCGEDELALLIRSEGTVSVGFWSPGAGEFRTADLGGVAPGGSLACSPDGSALVVQGVMDGGVGLHLHLRDGETLALHLPEGVIPHGVEWEAPRRDPVPERLRVAGARTLSVPWGETVKLKAVLEGTQESPPPDGVRWMARDARAVRISEEGLLLGMEEGSTWVVAEWEGWLRDSIHVEVRGAAHPEALFLEAFADPALPRWVPSGGREPDMDEEWMGEEWEVVAGGVLRLAGQGRGEDLQGEEPGRGSAAPLELVMNEGVWLPEGGTLEVEIRLPLHHQEGQQVEICLESWLAGGTSLPSDLPLELPLELPLDPAIQTPAFSGACLAYPAASGPRWDPREVVLRAHSPFPGTFQAVPEHLPSHEWVPFALRIQTDGSVAGFVGWEGTRIDSPVKLRDAEQGPWRIRIRGRADGTALEIRNLSLWSGSGPRP